MRTHPSRLGTAALFLACSLGGTSFALAQSNAGANSTSSSAAAERDHWREVAHERFVSGEVKEALDALNEVGEPVVDRVRVEGLVRTKRDVVSDYLDIDEGELFTAARLSRLERRLDELPTASYGFVRYDPVRGAATITPIVYERQRFPHAPADWLPVAVRVAFSQEVQLTASDLFHWGEVWTPSFRFDRDWRRARVRMSVPAPGRIPGLLHVEALTESQAFEGASLGPLRQDHRLRTAASVSDWANGWLRWETGPAYDRINGTNYLNLNGQLTFRGIGDRAAIILTHGRWMSSTDSFTRTEVVLTGRSSTRFDNPLVSGMVGVIETGGPAPLTILPEAGTGQGQGVLLRAHRTDRRDLSGEEILGRRMWFATAEYEHPIDTRFGPIGLAGFADSVQAISRLNGRNSPLYVDIGAGLRLSPSRYGHRARLDFAYGLRDGRIRLSAGYVVPWGER